VKQRRRKHAEMTEELEKRSESETRKTEEIYAECNRMTIRSEGLASSVGTPVAGRCHSASSTSHLCHSPPGQAFFTSRSQREPGNPARSGPRKAPGTRFLRQSFLRKQESRNCPRKRYQTGPRIESGDSRTLPAKNFYMASGESGRCSIATPFLAPVAPAPVPSF